jgi:ubiquinone/menaquinone biosynthesis C-methylase UbiE
MLDGRKATLQQTLPRGDPVIAYTLPGDREEENPMTDRDTHHARIQAHFGAAAQDYLTSPTHAAGDDLAQIVAWAADGARGRVLDIATGAGHTALALAPLFTCVIASDLTTPMLMTARGAARERGMGNIIVCHADAENLPFANESFDVVTCRIAPHHFHHIDQFLAEVRRTLVPGGLFLLEDSVVPREPDLASFLNDVERLRDPTHVRSLSTDEWRVLIEDAHLYIEDTRLFPKTHALASWCDRARVPAEVRRQVEEVFRSAPPAVRAAFAIKVDASGRVESFSDQKLVLRARKATRADRFRGRGGRS